MTTEFDLQLMKAEYDKAIKSLVSSAKATAVWQGRAEVAEAALASLTSALGKPAAKTYSGANNPPKSGTNTGPTP